MRFGVIGLGEVFEKYHRAAIQSVDGQIVAVCDVDQDKLISFHGNKVQLYRDYKELLQQLEIDVVSVCTPNFLHVPVALYALKMGKQVILEKPLSTNIKDAQKLIDYPRSDTDVAVCFQRRFSEQALAIKSMARKKKIIKIDAHVFVRRDAPYWNEWRRNKLHSGGANLMNIDVHYFDLFQWWLGKEVVVNFAKTADREGIDQVVFALLDFHGVPVKFLGSSLHNDREIDICVTFEDGSVMIYDKDTGTHEQVYKNFLLGESFVTPQEALQSLKIVLDIYKANEYA